jgi:hypothetical protein
MKGDVHEGSPQGIPIVSVTRQRLRMRAHVSLSLRVCVCVCDRHLLQKTCHTFEYGTIKKTQSTRKGMFSLSSQGLFCIAYFKLPSAKYCAIPAARLLSPQSLLAYRCSRSRQRSPA